LTYQLADIGVESTPPFKLTIGKEEKQQIHKNVLKYKSKEKYLSLHFWKSMKGNRKALSEASAFCVQRSHLF
jgi:hypothetical protein